MKKNKEQTKKRVMGRILADEIDNQAAVRGGGLTGVVTGTKKNDMTNLSGDNDGEGFMDEQLF